MSFSLSQVTSLFGSLTNNSSGTNLLNALYGFANQGTGTTTLNPITALRNAETNQTQDIKAAAAQPAAQRAIATFNAAVGHATSVQQLLSNPSVMQVLLTANGLADQIPYTALARKALMSNVNDSSSLANTLTDTRWKPVVTTYDFANKGLSVIQNPSVISTIDNAYAEVTWRQSLDATTPGLSNALTFRAQASTITSVDQILGDPILRSVVTTALNIPLQIAFQPLEAQEKSISTRVDIAQFNKPQFVDSFIQRYLIAAQKSNTTNSATLPSVTTLATQAQGLVV